jgi:2-polyprenyl-3-methyl-5-hydroxy-6-metoxy-1,4-benzoquinol methylase
LIDCGRGRMRLLGRLGRALRYRMGMHVVAPQLAAGTDEGVCDYYNSRASDCSFLASTDHYERPRIDWMLARVRGGSLLELGCADGTVTAMLAERVERVVALDLCQESVARVRTRQLRNVRAVTGFIEHYEPAETFDWIVASEVLEHLRNPLRCVSSCLRWLKPGGSLLISCPDGDWEGDAIEHLHTFDFESFCGLMIRAGARSLHAFRIPDRSGRDRWLGAKVTDSRSPLAGESREC